MPVSFQPFQGHPELAQRSVGVRRGLGLWRAGQVEGARKAYRSGLFYDPANPAARARLSMLGG